MTWVFPSAKFSGCADSEISRTVYVPVVGAAHANLRGYCENGIQASTVASFSKAFLASRAIEKLHRQCSRRGASIESAALDRYLLRKLVSREQKLCQSSSAAVSPAATL